MSQSLNETYNELQRIYGLYSDTLEISQNIDEAVEMLRQNENDACQSSTQKLEKYRQELCESIREKVPKENHGIDHTVYMLPEARLYQVGQMRVKKAAIFRFMELIGFAAIFLFAILGTTAFGNTLICIFLVQLSIICAVVGLVGWLKMGKRIIGNLNDWETEVTEYESRLKDGIEKREKALTMNGGYLDALAKYEKEFLSVVDKFEAEKETISKENDAMLMELQKSTREEVAEMAEELGAKQGALNEQDIIAPDLFGEIPRILMFIRLGRASSLKEAINMAFDEIRAEQEEDARREEARRREAILEKQAADNRAHNEQMARYAEDQARQQREHDREMEAAAKAQTELAKKQSKAPCRDCANYLKCSFTVQSHATANCASYKPR